MAINEIQNKKVVLMDWQITISKVDNGYILEWEDEAEIAEQGEQVTFIKHKVLIEEQDTEFGEIESMQKVLIKIRDYFDVNYSKHNQKNIEVEIK